MDSGSLRHPSGLLLSSVMPPLLKGDILCSSFGLRCGAALGAYSMPYWVGCPARIDGGRSSHHIDGALRRREAAIQSEWEQLKWEVAEGERQAEREKQQREDHEERRRLIEAAVQAEERVQKQHEQLLLREQELEEWKFQRVKDAEAARLRRVEAEEKRQELRFQQEMERFKVEADHRASLLIQQQQQQGVTSETVQKQMEKAIQELQEELGNRFEVQWKSREAEFGKESKMRDEEWKERLGELEIHRSTEMAELQLQLRQSVETASGFERRVVDAKEEIQRLTGEIENLKKLISSGGGRFGELEGGTALAAKHKRAIESLRETFEEDKSRARRQYNEEVERLKFEMERRCEEMRDHHRVQLRSKEEELEQVRHQHQDAQREVEDLKSKLALSSQGTGGLSLQEEARLKEELRTTRSKIHELEEEKSRVDRRLREKEAQLDKQSTTIQGLQAELQKVLQRKEQEIEDLRSETHRIQTSLKSEKESLSEEVHELRAKLDAAEARAQTAMNSQELESSMRQLKESRDTLRRDSEAQREQLENKIKILEEEKHSFRRKLDEREREVSTNSQRVLQEQRLREEKLEEARKALQEKTRAAEQAESQLRAVTAQLQRVESELRDERAQREDQQRFSAESMGRELQRKTTELQECQKELVELRELRRSLETNQGEEVYRMQRKLREKETELLSLQRQFDDFRGDHSQCREKLDDITRRMDSLTQSNQRALRQKEDEIDSLQQRVTQLSEEKLRAERDLRLVEEQRTFASQDANKQHVLMQEKMEMIHKLEGEVRQCRQNLEAQRATEEDLRNRLARETANSMTSSMHFHRSASPEAMPASSATLTQPGAPVSTLVHTGSPRGSPAPTPSSPVSAGRAPLALPGQGGTNALRPIATPGISSGETPAAAVAPASALPTPQRLSSPRAMGPIEASFSVPAAPKVVMPPSTTLSAGTSTVLQGITSSLAPLTASPRVTVAPTIAGPSITLAPTPTASPSAVAAPTSTALPVTVVPPAVSQSPVAGLSSSIPKPAAPVQTFPPPPTVGTTGPRTVVTSPAVNSTALGLSISIPPPPPTSASVPFSSSAVAIPKPAAPAPAVPSYAPPAPAVPSYAPPAPAVPSYTPPAPAVPSYTPPAPAVPMPTMQAPRAASPRPSVAVGEFGHSVVVPAPAVPLAVPTPVSIGAPGHTTRTTTVVAPTAVPMTTTEKKKRSHHRH